MQPNDAVRYDFVAVTLHWVIAVSIIAMIPLGFFMGDLPISIKFDAYVIHKSLGITVLALSIFRFVWRLMNPPPALPVSMKPVEKLLAHGAHWALYGLMVAMPLTGWLFVSASHKYPTIYFWMGEVPFIPLPAGIDQNATAEWFKETHELLAYGALVLIAAHIFAALKHHFVAKDHILTRMLPTWAIRR